MQSESDRPVQTDPVCHRAAAGVSNLRGMCGIVRPEDCGNNPLSVLRGQVEHQIA